MIVRDGEMSVLKIAVRFPSVLLRSIAFPLDEILELSVVVP